MQSNYQASISDLNLTSQNPYGGPQAQSGQRHGQQQQQQHQQPYDAPRPSNMNRFDSPYMRPQDDPHGGLRRTQGDAPNSPSRNMPPRGPPGYPPSDPHQQPLGSYDPPATARQRSPSPTPTEILEINRPLYDLTPYKSKKYWLQWRLVPWYIGGIILIAGFTLLTIYHKEVVNYLKPAADWAAGLKFGWLIPIAVLFVISFPPLFGHEIVAVICGLVWGLWVGFGIVCVGTLLGEIGNYYAFLYCCRARAEKMEKEKPYYDCLARVVREGGFKVALMARLSAIPGHFTTAIFATCGMNIFVFTIAAILSLPKQFITVYAGVVLEANSEEKKENKPQNDTDKVTKIISNVVAGFSLFITFFALWWIYREMIKVKPIVFRERRKARLAKLQAAQAADRDGDFGTSNTRVGSVRFDKYGGSVDPMDSSQTLTRGDDYEMRGRKREEYEGRGRKPINEAQFNANSRQGQDGEEWSVESDVPLSTPAMKVEYDSYIGVDDRVPYGHVQGPTEQGYASKGQQYRGDYDGDIVRPGQQPAGPTLQGSGQQYHQHTGKLQKRPPSAQRTGPASETPRGTPPAIQGPPPAAAYTPPPGPPVSSGRSVQRPVDPSVASGGPSEHMPQFFHSAMPPTDASTSSYASSQVFERPKPPPTGAGFAKPVTMAPQHYPPPPEQYRPPQQPPAFASPPSSPPNGPAQVTPSASDQTVRATSPPNPYSSHGHGGAALAVAGSGAHPRKESSHAREATEYLGAGHGHRGPTHASEASAYYSASEGEDEHDDRMTGLPPKTESRMPGQLFREQSEPQWR